MELQHLIDQAVEHIGAAGEAIRHARDSVARAAALEASAAARAKAAPGSDAAAIELIDRRSATTTAKRALDHAEKDLAARKAHLVELREELAFDEWSARMQSESYPAALRTDEARAAYRASHPEVAFPAADFAAEHPDADRAFRLRGRLDGSFLSY